MARYQFVKPCKQKIIKIIQVCINQALDWMNARDREVFETSNLLFRLSHIIRLIKDIADRKNY